LIWGICRERGCIFTPFASFALYLKLLRLTAAKSVLNQCIYWMLGIVSALSFPFVVGYLSLLAKGFLQ